MHYFSSRRTFIKRLALGTGALFAADLLIADPYQPLPVIRPAGKPVKISGFVRSGKKGLAGIAVSDGSSVAVTNKDGAYTLVADSKQPFVFITLPSGYLIPQNASGTANFYQPISTGDTQLADWNLLPAPSADTRHGFLVMADPQTLDMEDMRRFQQETAADARQLLGTRTDLPWFNVACGDIMFDDLSLYPEYEKAVTAMGIPSFQVVGNHDLDFGNTDELSVQTFRKYFGPNYYSFNRGEVHYVVLDDVFYHGNGYMGYVDQTQLEWLRADLAQVEKGKTVVVFAHIPVYTRQFERDDQRGPDNSVVIANRQLLYRALEGYKAHLIAGHTHFSERLTDGGISIHVAGAACGAWWTGDICYDGTPNGYAVYEVNGSNFISSYKSTGKPLDHQMRIYQPGSDRKAPGELVANVWDADDSWQVFWYEDGMKKGKMARRIGADPLSVELHTGNQLPKKHPWVDPEKTGHLYYAPVSTEAKTVMVEAVNAEGKVFTTRL